MAIDIDNASRQVQLKRLVLSGLQGEIEVASQASLSFTEPTPMVRRVATHLMFTGEASAALELYAAVFPEFHVDRVDRYGPGGPGRRARCASPRSRSASRTSSPSTAR